MRKNRVILWLTAVAIIFNYICTIPVFADKTDAALSDKAQVGAELLNAIGIDFPKNFGGEDAVTRADFVYILMQTIRFDYYTGEDSGFKDVAKTAYYNDAIVNALRRGIITEGESFSPNSPVTMNEAYKMLVTSLGRYYIAETKGGYPRGYNTVAYDCRLNKGITAVGDTQLGINDFYLLMKNFLECNKLYKEDGIVNDSISVTAGTTPLEEYFDIYTVEGIITSNEYSSLYDGSIHTGENYVEIDNIIYRYEGKGKLGYCVSSYIRTNDGGTDEIVYLDYTENEVLAIDAADVVSAEGGRIKYYQTEIKTASEKLKSGYACIYNGKAYPGYMLNNLPDIDGHIELVDNDGDGSCDVINIYNETNMFIDAVDIYDELLIDKNSSAVDLGRNSDIKYTVEKDGEVLDITDIPKGGLITCYVSEDELLYRIVINENSISGTVTSINSSEKKLYINNTEYKYGDYFESYYLDKLNLGSEGEFYLSLSGRIEAMAETFSTDMQYVYFITAYRDDIAEDEPVSLKVFTSAGSIQKYEVDDKPYFDGKRVTAEYVYNTLRPGAKSISQLIRMKLNKNGMIKYIDTQNHTGYLTGKENENDNLTLFQFPANVYSTIWYNSRTSMFYPYFRITSSTTIFYVSNSGIAADEKRYRLKDKSYFEQNETVKPGDIHVYNVDATGNAGAVLLKSDSAVSDSVSDTSESGVVSRIKKSLAPDEEVGLEIEVCVDKKFSTYYITDPNIIATIAAGATVDNPCLYKGDYIRFDYDEDGLISAISKDFDIKEHKVLKTFGNHGFKCEYYYGKVYAKDGDMVSVIPENIPGIAEDITNKPMRYCWPLSGVVSVYNREDNTVELSTTDTITSYLTSGNSGSDVLVRTKSGAVVDIVVYK